MSLTLTEIAVAINSKTSEQSKNLTETTNRIDECNQIALAALKSGDTMTATTMLKRIDTHIKPK